MSADPIPKARMSVDEFLVWGEGRPGRYELLDGEVIAMSPERVRHAEVKASAWLVLRDAIAKARIPCRVLPDGMTVRIAADTAYEPDALVYCGSHADPDALEIPDPVVIVEVLSPTTRAIDLGSKLTGYFGLASVEHYLILDPVRRCAIHHRRGTGDLIETRIVREGVLDLTPPGLGLPVAALFADLPPLDALR